MYILRLTLEKRAFEITGTEEKPFEIRNAGPWIESRIFLKDGNIKDIWHVDLYNGYGDVPYKRYEFKGLEVFYIPIEYKFSNGLVFKAARKHYKIHLGQLLESRNLK